MSHTTCEQTKRAALQVFTAQLCQAVRQRMAAGRPLVVDLLRGLVICRFTGPQAPQPLDITSAHLMSSRSYRRLTTFPQLLREPIAAALKAAGPLDASGAAMPFLALQAISLASRLMEQMGVQDPVILDYSRRPPELETLVREGLSAATTARSSANACAAKVVEGLRRRLAVYAKEQNRIAALLLLRADGVGVWVDGLTGSGDHIFTFSLHDFAASFLAPAVESVLEEMHRKQPTWQSHRETGREILKDVCPSLANAVELAHQDAQPVGIRLCTGRSRRGSPLDMWFFVDARASQPQWGCVLSVSRPHRDFILEAADGSRYYFPPCLLSARFTFLEQMPRAEYPVVRQPAGGYHWCHPYTGKLLGGPIGGAKLLHDENVILHTPCDQAIALFPQLNRRTQTPMENNLCLGGQPAVLGAIQEKLHSALMQSSQPDVLAAATALHDIARLGLTRGHQNNMGGPRARLDPLNMPYPMMGRQVSGILAKRIYVFAPPGTTLPRTTAGASALARQLRARREALRRASQRAGRAVR